MEELKNPFKYPKYGDWIWNAKNMHIMNWVLNVRKERRMQKEERELIIIDLEKSLRNYGIQQLLYMLIRRIVLRFIKLNGKLAQFKLGNQPLCNFYAKLQRMWQGLKMHEPMHPSCNKEQVEVEAQHIFKLVEGLNPKYEFICA